jgi:hypothetical protein
VEKEWWNVLEMLEVMEEDWLMVRRKGEVDLMIVLVMALKRNLCERLLRVSERAWCCIYC